MVRLMASLRTAIAFLTRVPVASALDGETIEIAPAWFPLVGAVIGGLSGGVYALGVSELPRGLAAALALAAAALVTGGFHHDGLADIADAFGGGRDRAERLEILRDPRHGTYGVLAIVFSILVQFSALSTLGAAAGFAALVAAHALGRAVAVGLALSVAPVRESGLGAVVARTSHVRLALLGIGVGVVIALLVIGPWGALTVIGAALSTLAVGRLSLAKIGGAVGDTLGAAEQVAESVVLVVVVAVVHGGHHVPWWS
jgi:adenosylcobinamide-GDP ribazoletransferase